MDIKYFGHSSFLIRGRAGSVVTDPFNQAATGLKFPPRVESEIVTISHDHQDHNAAANIAGNPFVVSGPGEYEIKGVSILGYRVFHDEEGGKTRGVNVIYRLEIDGVKIVHLGDIGQPLSDGLVEELGEVDILFIPVGGHFTIGPSDAKKIISEIEPLIYIPMHYRTPFHLPAFAELKTLADFLKEMSVESVVPVPKLSVTKDKLPAQTTITVLS
jgi:L-ascorbate metabolism protein UlaG (beta-lactamase superfamily)